MQIVRAKRGDVREISSCRRESIQSMAEVYSRENLNVLLSNSFENGIVDELENGEVFCLVSNGEIVGNVSLLGNQISGLYVRPKFSGMGYGQKLLEHIEEYCRSNGTKEVYLYSTLNAKDFYLHNGYLISGVAYGFPINKPTKFIQMKKTL